MNFLQLVQRLHSESLRSTAQPTDVTDTSARPKRLADWIADAWREIQSDRDWRWMRTTLDVALTVGLQTYDATSNFSATRFGRWRPEDSDYQPVLYRASQPNALWFLSYWQLDQFRQEFIYRTWGQTLPIAWTWDENNQLLIGPAPSEAFKLRIEYWKEPSELAANDDTPDMPNRFHMLLVWRALRELAEADAAPELLTKSRDNYDPMLRRLLRDQARQPHL